MEILDYEDEDQLLASSPVTEQAAKFLSKEISSTSGERDEIIFSGQEIISQQTTKTARREDLARICSPARKSMAAKEPQNAKQR